LKEKLKTESDKKAVRDNLGKLLSGLEHALSRIAGTEPADLKESGLVDEAVRAISTTVVFLQENMGSAEAVLFTSLSECKWTPVSRPILIPDMFEAAKQRQGMIDTLRQYSIQLKRIIENTRQS